MAKITDLKAEDYLKLYAPFIGMIVFGGIISYFFHSVHLINSFAEACIVAGSLGIGFEIYSTQILIKQVSDELAEKLVGRGLPERLQKKIREIVKTSLVREDWVKAYSFADQQNNKVVITINMTYRVRNYDYHSIEYSPFLAEERVYDPKFLSLHYASQDHDGYTFNEEELASIRKECTGKSTSVTGPNKVTIEPICRNKEAYCDVTWRYQVTMSHEDSDIMSFDAATMGVKIRIDRYPSGYNVSAVGAGMRHIPNSDIWDFDESFINGQHIRVRWYPMLERLSIINGADNLLDRQRGADSGKEETSPSHM